MAIENVFSNTETGIAGADFRMRHFFYDLYDVTKIARSLNKNVDNDNIDN